MVAMIPRAQSANANAAKNQYVRVGAGQYRGSDGRIVTQSQRDRRLRQAQTTPAAPAAPAAPATPATPAPAQAEPQAPGVSQAPAAAAPQQPQQSYRTYRDFLPSDVTSSPEYQWRLQQSQKAMDSKLASMGLSNSGAAIAKELGMVNELTDSEIDRQTKLATIEADRYERVQENEAMRSERAGSEQFKRMFDLMNLASRQNPLEQAYRASSQIGDSYVDQGNYAANVARDQYGRIRGGNATMAPVYTPPFASGPDYSRANEYRIGANDATNDGYINSVGRIVGSIFGGGLF